MNKISVVVLDDHQLVLDGIQSMLRNHPKINLMAAFQNADEALAYLDHNETNLLITDLDMPGRDGLEVASICKSKYPETRVMIISMHDEKSVIQKMIRAGVDGYLIKTVGKDEFCTAIEAINNGIRYFPTDVLRTLTSETFTHKRPHELLTNREQEIIQHIAAGKTSKDIASELSISIRTVETHRTNLFQKLEVSSVVGLVKYAIENNLA